MPREVRGWSSRDSVTLGQMALEAKRISARAQVEATSSLMASGLRPSSSFKRTAGIEDWTRAKAQSTLDKSWVFAFADSSWARRNKLCRSRTDPAGIPNRTYPMYTRP